MVGLSLNVPLYTGGYRSAKLQEAVSAQAQAEAEYGLAVQQTQQQARSVWLALQTGPARLSALQAAWKASTARLDATRLGRQVGDRTTLELLQAENDSAQAELAWLRAQTNQAPGDLHWQTVHAPVLHRPHLPPYVLHWARVKRLPDGKHT